MKSNLDLVKECDSFPYLGTLQYTDLLSTFYTLTYTSPSHPSPIPIGYIPEFVFNALSKVPISIKGELSLHRPSRTLSAFPQPTEQERSAAVAKTCAHWREQKTFKVLEGWRNELYPVYGPKNELLFNIERSASPLFGVATYGIHMTCYTYMTPEEKKESGSAYDFRLWIPRRSKQKQTYGGMLDNTVAGGIASGESPFESMVREADEEASLPEQLVREKTQVIGTVTYIHLRTSKAGGETGVVMPETQYTYDLELPRDVVPAIKDGEVEEFYLWTVEETQARLGKGEFKPNCAMVVIDFFLRRGVLTRENDGDYEEMVRRCHRELPFPGWDVER